MAILAALAPELILHIVSFLAREIILDPDGWVLGVKSGQPELVPALPSVNALCQTSTIYHSTLDKELYRLCATVEAFGKLALLFAVEHELESTFDKLGDAKIDSLAATFVRYDRLYSLLNVAAEMGSRDMVVKLLGMYGEGIAHIITLKSDIQTVRAAFPAGAADGVVATVLAMAFLSTKLGAKVDRDSWEGIYEKARQYVEAALRNMRATETAESLETKVAQLLA
jgi:hypothetical protein